MSKIPNIIKFCVTLFFIDLILILNHLKKPYFVIGGIIYIENIIATIIILVISLIILYLGYNILKLNKSVFNISRYFFIFLIINSIINLIASIFLTKDMAGFLSRVFGEDVFVGYILVQLMIILVNVSLYWLIKVSKNLLR
jgi:hypothetical protein